MTASARPALLALLLIASAGFISRAIRPPELPATGFDLRFHGLPRALGDLLWIKTAQRVASMSRVTPSEAFRNYRTIRVASRLHPDYAEPYLCGIVAMCLWNRRDLAVDLIREGVRLFPVNRHIRFAAFGVVTVFGENISDMLREVPALAEPVPEAARSHGYLEANELVALFWTIRARRLEDDGRVQEALDVWKRILAEYSYNGAIEESALGAIARIEKKLAGG